MEMRTLTAQVCPEMMPITCVARCWAQTEISDNGWSWLRCAPVQFPVACVREFSRVFNGAEQGQPESKKIRDSVLEILG